MTVFLLQVNNQVFSAIRASKEASEEANDAALDEAGNINGEGAAMEPNEFTGEAIKVSVVAIAQ